MSDEYVEIDLNLDEETVHMLVEYAVNDILSKYIEEQESVTDEERGDE